jgi:hypothetical protein
LEYGRKVAMLRLEVADQKSNILTTRLQINEAKLEIAQATTSVIEGISHSGLGQPRL